MTVEYEVKFKGYRYNTGRGDNGIYECVEHPKDIEGVKIFVNALKKMTGEDISDEDKDFLHDFYGIDYVTEIVEISKITKEQIKIE